MGGYFLVIVDARTKWMDVHFTGKHCTTAVTVEKLRESFATHGLPDTVVSDNGPALEFLIQNGVHHIRTAAYHPASNGLAERSVQTFKNGMK